MSPFATHTKTHMWELHQTLEDMELAKEITHKEDGNMCALNLHQRLNNLKKNCHKGSHHCVQIPMHNPNMLAKNHKCKVANSITNFINHDLTIVVA
jgi:hypothetical protein